MKPLIYVVGFGPGDRPYITQQAIDAVTQADLVVGYTTYIQLLEEQFPELRYYATPMRKETDRCRAAVEAALTGKTVALVSSGDSGIYGMAYFWKLRRRCRRMWKSLPCRALRRQVRRRQSWAHR